MITKTIHYCWFGRNPKPKLALKCIRSWKRHCPDYQIIEWNEDNFDISSCPLYVRQAYEAKKWAFVTDYVRLWAMTKFGGIYMDTDVEVIKSLDELLYVEGFSGFESKATIPTGIMASKKDNKWILQHLDSYKNSSFFDNAGNMNLETNVKRITEISKKFHGFIPNGKMQELLYGFIIYPKYYFCPKSALLGTVNITPKTYTIHHFAGSWLDNDDKERASLYKEKVKKIMNRI